MSIAPPQRPLADLLADLEAAVRAGDRALATELAQAIQQQLASSAADRARIEREVRAQLAELDRPAVIDFDPFDLKRGIVAEDVVYPVWFGTNRKPEGSSFGSQRHDQVTLGRALVRVPGIRRYGELGSSFWRRMMRFDLRNDALRLQQVDRQE